MIIDVVNKNRWLLCGRRSSELNMRPYLLLREALNFNIDRYFGTFDLARRSSDLGHQ